MLVDPGKVCGWCRTEPATTIKYATPSCFTCAAGNAKLRISRWFGSLRSTAKQVRS